MEFKDAPAPVREEIISLLETDETPVIVATNGTSWTCVTDQRALSSHDSSVVSVRHRQIQRTVSLPIDEGAGDKVERVARVEWILLGPEKIPLWIPKGQLCTCLMNTLLMLPLGSGEDE